MKNIAPIGVVVGRFQIPNLHDGHKSLLDEVQNRHEKMIIFVGVHPFPATKSCPLDYATRAYMLNEAYPNAIVLPIKDVPSDKIWSDMLNSGIRLVAPFGDAVLYGSRDSFIKHYTGGFTTCILEPPAEASGSEVRRKIYRQMLTTYDQRLGAIYTTGNSYNRVLPTVDIAVIGGPNKFSVLLGRKKHDEGCWRFPGGFVETRHASLEDAAKAELSEETGLETDSLKYVGSFKVDDWRCTPSEQIITTFFMTKHVWGAPQAGDDLDEIEWFPLNYDLPRIVPMHKPLVAALLREIAKGE